MSFVRTASDVRLYVDASAAAKLLTDEPGTDDVVELLNVATNEAVSSDLLETELRRTAARLSAGQTRVAVVLDGIELHALERSDFRAAGLIPGRHLRSLDALHLQGALRLAADAVLTFDTRLAAAAEAVGLEVLPGS